LTPIYEIQSNNSSLKVLVIRTNEKLEITQQTVERILAVAQA
jgi:acetate kinase